MVRLVSMSLVFEECGSVLMSKELLVMMNIKQQTQSKKMKEQGTWSKERDKITFQKLQR